MGKPIVRRKGDKKAKAQRGRTQLLRGKGGELIKGEKKKAGGDHKTERTPPRKRVGDGA